MARAVTSRPMSTNLKIDFVSDVSCPWCAIGLAALEQALGAVKSDITVDMHFQPFELNPQMGPEGQDITEPERLRGLLDSLCFGIVLCGEDGRVQWVNRQATAQLAPGAALSLQGDHLNGRSVQDTQSLLGARHRSTPPSSRTRTTWRGWCVASR